MSHSLGPYHAMMFSVSFANLIDGGEGQRKGWKILFLPYYFDFS